MSISFEAACACHIGYLRSSNEDNFYFAGQQLEENNKGLDAVASSVGTLDSEQCFAVFDGMGGESFGARASFLAAKTLQSALHAPREQPFRPEQFLLDSCLHMNALICEAAETRAARMGSTAVLLHLQGDSAHICNLGDSPAFLLRGGQLHHLTVDHVEIPPPARAGQHKPALLQHLGISPEDLTIMPYLAKGVVQTGDQFLLCSDGLTNMLSKEDIQSILQVAPSAKDCVQAMMEQALAHGGRDNITVIVCRMH